MVNWKQGEWKSDIWLLVLILLIVAFFVGGRLVR